MDRRNPECRPLCHLDDVLSWKPGTDDLCVARIQKRPRKSEDRPRLLVCHDLKGGYLEDRLVQGCGKPNSYRFYHWQLVDTFVYFSHYLVTIPPPAWTNAGHRHGVPVLGTLITESEEGKLKCEIFLKSKESCKQLADQLVQITQYYGFDGWLVNIENVIEKEEHIINLIWFLKYLTDEQHKHVPGSQVIWYDSVVKTGKLDWQNALNDDNRMFFDVCDGIFLNYCWMDEHLQMSKTCVDEMKRPYNVYVGIDVFGRGCRGGGGFNTREALEAVRKHNLSAAIFAPGWVYETLGTDNFTSNENKFWALIQDLCYHASFTTLPLTTTFCQGFGERFFDNGIPVGNPWWNMNIQQLQPFYYQPDSCASMVNDVTSPIQPTDKNSSSVITTTATTWKQSGEADLLSQIDICSDDAYIGGSCLKLEAEVVHNKFVKHSLFMLDVDLKQYTSVYVSLTYKILQDPDCDVFLELHLKHDDQSIVLVFLPFPDGDKPVPVYGKDMACMYIHAMNQCELPKLLSLSCPQPNNTRWKTKWFPVYSLYLKFCKLKQVKVCLTTTDPQPKTCIALLGELKIIPVECLPDSFPGVEFVSVTADTSTSYPLLDVSKNNYDSTEDQSLHNPNCVNWGVDAFGNPITISYDQLDKMRVSCHTLREFRSTIGGQFCEVLYQLITSLDCFTIQWLADNADAIDHYRVYQIKIDSGVAKLMGHVTEPYFKVTWFEIPDYEKDELIHHFKYVVRPVLKCGIAVPLDYTYCKLFHIASRRDMAMLIKDSSTEMVDNAQDSKGQDCCKCDVARFCPENSDAKANCSEDMCKHIFEMEAVNCDKGVCSSSSSQDNIDGAMTAEKLTSENIEKLTQNLNLSDE